MRFLVLAAVFVVPTLIASLLPFDRGNFQIAHDKYLIPYWYARDIPEGDNYTWEGEMHKNMEWNGGKNMQHEDMDGMDAEPYLLVDLTVMSARFTPMISLHMKLMVFGFVILLPLGCIILVL